MALSGLSPGDIQGRTVNPIPLAVVTLNLASGTTQTIATLPSVGSQRVRVYAVVLESPVGVTAQATASFGSSGGLTDFAPAAALGVNFPIVITPTTDLIYTGGTVFRANVTVAGTGTCTATLYGYVN